MLVSTFPELGLLSRSSLNKEEIAPTENISVQMCLGQRRMSPFLLDFRRVTMLLVRQIAYLIRTTTYRRVAPRFPRHAGRNF